MTIRTGPLHRPIFDIHTGVVSEWLLQVLILTLKDITTQLLNANCLKWVLTLKYCLSAVYLKWVLGLKFEKHKSGEMAGDIERRWYFLKLNMHQCRCLIAELYIKDKTSEVRIPSVI